MEESELEEWFSSRREALEQEFLGAGEQERARFDAQYRALLAQYQERSQRIVVRSQRHERRKRPWLAAQERATERMRDAREWLARTRTGLRKWLSDMKTRRMLRHRGPY